VREALTIAVGTDGKTKLISGFDVPYDQQRKAFFDAKPSRGVAELQLWISDQPRKRRIFTKQSGAASTNEEEEDQGEHRGHKGKHDKSK
jgi:hypothetical protein